MATELQKQRAARKYRSELLREKGRIPSRIQYVYRVEPEIIAIPPWAYLNRIPDLTSNGDYVWLGDKTLARIVANMDRAEGGRPRFDRFEAKRCRVCGMLRMGELARSRRRLDESAEDGRFKPCSAECMTRYHQQRGRL